ncbi:MAG: hypothetical protein ABSH56_11720 [Bryobacteraceae bacterium]
MKRNQITSVGRLLTVIVVLLGSSSLAQSLSDPEIQAAIKRGQSTPNKVLWQELRKKESRIFRGKFGNPYELWVALLTDADRIAIEAAYAQHELREFSIEDGRKLLGRTQVLLEAKQAGYYWTKQGGVHVVLKVGGTIIQPLEKENVVPVPTSWLAGLLDVSALTWFTFPEIPKGVQSVTVTVIPGSGTTKEKEITIR